MEGKKKVVLAATKDCNALSSVRVEQGKFHAKKKHKFPHRYTMIQPQVLTLLSNMHLIFADLQTCCKLLQQLAASLWISSLDKSVVATCIRLDVFVRLAANFQICCKLISQTAARLKPQIAASLLKASVLIQENLAAN